MKKTNKRGWCLALTLAFSLQILAFLPGCAIPHRQADTTHSVEVFTNRPDGLIGREVWRDAEGGGGFFFFADPSGHYYNLEIDTVGGALSLSLGDTAY